MRVWGTGAGPGESQLWSSGLHPRPLGWEAEQVRSGEAYASAGPRVQPLGHGEGRIRPGVLRKPVPLRRARIL